MTMAYLSSFDVSSIGAGALTLSTSGESDISINLALFTWPNQFGTSVSVFNHMVASDWEGFGPFAEFPLFAIASNGFIEAVQAQFRALATTATWSSPNSITLSLNTTTWLVTFAYSGSLTAITFGNTETRRLFGFGGDFSGSSASVSGTDVPKYIIVPDVDGASSVTPIFEQDVVASFAYAADGQPYSLARSTNSRMRRWTQQYETRGRTFRKHALTIPNEFTWQHLFEHCRARYPFGVFGGFGEDAYEAYIFRNGAESFHPLPATPGSANQFHIPFDCLAMGRG